MERSRVFGWDLETNQLSPFRGEPRILTAAIASEDEEVAYLLDHPLDAETTDEQLDDRVAKLQQVLGDPQNVIVGHGVVMFDALWWTKLTGLEVGAQFFDIRTAQSLIDENEEDNSLAWVATEYTPYRKIEIKRKELSSVEPAKVLQYNLMDAKISLAAYGPMRQRLVEEEQWLHFEDAMEEYRTLLRMALRGVRVDVPFLRRRERELLQQKQETSRKIFDLIGGREFNLNSPKQLAEVMYDELRFDVLEHTKSGAPSTSAQTLKMLRMKSKPGPVQDWLGLLLEVRGQERLLSTYARPLQGKYLGDDGRVHPQIFIGRGYDAGNRGKGTRTGRLSMSDPNLQNQPRDGNTKQAFIPTEGYLLGEADYSQVEMRIAAWASRERVLLNAFRQGLDVHTAALAALEDKPYEWVRERVSAGDTTWKTKRTEIKTVNFLILYGGGVKALQTQLLDLGIFVTLRQARQIISRFYEKYPDLVGWIETEKKQISDSRMALTAVGLKRRLHEAGSEYVDWVRERALRQGVNFLVQSLSASITRRALVLLERELEQFGGYLLTSVHDSVLFEYPVGTDEAKLKSVVEETLTAGTLRALETRYDVSLDIPLAVDLTVGMTRWGDSSSV